MTTSPRSQEGLAFEYVAGTLNASERVAYERKLEQSEQERALVQFWTEQLNQLDLSAGELAPKNSTWPAIERATGNTQEARTPPQSNLSLTSWFKWALPGFAMLLLAVVLVGKPFLQQSDSPNTDYIAVLTNDDGGAVLTALTTQNDSKMWLKWEGTEPAEEQSLQLWAISKRDGQVRSIAVFEDAVPGELALNEANFRLVSDSSFLLLTLEEPGGSAIDEPSEDLIAKGVCVRFSGET